MIYFEDTGSIIDAPIDFVWRYLLSEHHAPAHAGSARNFELTETVGSTALVSADRLVNGKWAQFVTKSTDYPPLCIVNEEVEGDFAGSRFVLVYRPKGEQTQVDAFGYIESKAGDAKLARATFLKLLDQAYQEDVLAIGKLRGKSEA